MPSPPGGADAAATTKGAGASPARFRGIVQNDRLEPLAGAAIAIVALEKPSGEAGATDTDEANAGPGRRFARGRANAEPHGTFFTATSDASGAFTIEAEGTGSFNLRVAAAGFAPAVLEGVAPGESVSTIYLKKGVAAKGTVADLATGVPVQDALVIAIPDEERGFRDPDDLERFRSTGRSGRDGTFTIADLAPGFTRFRVVARGKAAFTDGPQSVGGSGAAPLLFYLSPGYDVAGRVLDPAGKPISGITASLRPDERTGPGMRLRRERFTPLTARTDKEGKFALQGVPASGKFRIEIDDDRFAPARLEIPPQKAGATLAGLEIRLEKGATLRVKLVDADSRPVTKGVEVSLNYRDPKTRRPLQNVDRSGKELRASADGTTTIDRLPAGIANVTLSAEGFLEVARKNIAVGVDARGADLGTIALDRGKTISGRVLDAAGKPLGAVKIVGSSWTPGRAFRSAETRSDANGRFTLSGLEEGRWSLEGTLRGYAKAEMSDIAPGGEPVEISMEKAGAITGRVLAGDPPRLVSSFSIQASAQSSTGGPGAFRRMMTGDQFRNMSDSRGEFSIEGLTPGSYTVTCRTDGMMDLIREGVEVRAGETTPVGDLTLAAGGTIRGRVQSKPEGLPVAGAAVRIKSSGLLDFRRMMGGDDQAVLTDLAGRFELRGLPAGSMTLIVEPENYARTEVAGIVVDPGTEPEELQVSVGKGGRIEGRVVGAGGRPSAGSVVIVMAGLADLSARLTGLTDEQGNYAIENIAPGSYRVASVAAAPADDQDEDGGTAGRRMGGMEAVSADVKDGETTVVNFGLKQIKVSGLLRRKSGETADQLVLFVPPGRGARMSAQTAHTDATGHYELTLSEPGDYDVHIGDSGMRGGSALHVTIPDEAEVKQDLTVPEGAISGRVIDEKDGKPLKGAMVTVQARATGGGVSADSTGSSGSRTNTARATSGEDGVYRVDGLAAGKYDVQFSVDGYGAEVLEAVEVKGTDEVGGVDQLMAAAQPVRIKVRGPSGAGVSGALVMVSRDGTMLSGVTGMTGIDGSIDLRQLKSSVYSFFAAARDYAPAVVRDFQVGGEQEAGGVMLTLTPGGSARIVVQDAEKKPLSGVSLTLASSEGADLDQAVRLIAMMQGAQLTTGGDGAVSLDHLAPGKYQVTATRGEKSLSESLTVEEGSRASLTIPFE